MPVNLRKLGPSFLAAMLLVGCCAAVMQPSLDGYQEGVVKSLNSKTETQITFINRSSQEVRVYWLDFDGHRVLYKVLEAGDSYDQQTYLTHPWLVTDAHGKAWHIYFADALPRVINIVSPDTKK